MKDFLEQLWKDLLYLTLALYTLIHISILLGMWVIYGFIIFNVIITIYMNFAQYTHWVDGHFKGKHWERFKEVNWFHLYPNGYTYSRPIWWVFYFGGEHCFSHLPALIWRIKRCYIFKKNSWIDIILDELFFGNIFMVGFGRKERINKRKRILKNVKDYRTKQQSSKRNKIHKYYFLIRRLWKRPESVQIRTSKTIW